MPTSVPQVWLQAIRAVRMAVATNGLRLTCRRVRWHVPGIVHHFEFGGGTAEEPDMAPEDLCLWLPERGVFVAITGNGCGIGLLGGYLSSSPFGRAMLGVLGGMLAPGASGQAHIEPADAADDVRACWSLGEGLAPVGLATVRRELLELVKHFAERVDSSPHFFSDLIVATLLQVAVAWVAPQPDRSSLGVHLENAGAHALYLCQRGEITQAVPIGTLLEEVRASGADTSNIAEWMAYLPIDGIGIKRTENGTLMPVGSDANESVRNRLINARRTVSLRPGDAIGIYNLGTFQRVPRATLEASLRATASAGLCADSGDPWPELHRAVTESEIECRRHATAAVLCVVSNDAPDRQ